MGFLSFLGLVNNNQTASELAKDMSSGVDMMFHTEEEKAIEAASTQVRKIAATEKAMESWLRMVEVMKNSEAYRSVTRRVLALGSVFSFFCMIWLCIWAEFAAMFGWFGACAVVGVDATLTPLTIAVLKIAGAFELGWVFCTIIVFYFGPQLVQYLSAKKVSK